MVAGRKQVRRVAEAGGLRLVAEDEEGGQRVASLSPADADRSLAEVLAEHRSLLGAEGSGARTRAFLRCGRAAVALSLGNGTGDDRAD
ncbi:hypothetical protein [Streptacidiphilus melanogenes]|uniref:hypothetical protein n=1 Tax=Streptacidiphilus melanogenes TaxID=411235 RepID=UPI0005AAA041|nr:hypothetical protein [Streptacidiphilus melanogenes]